jgi:hypothetical protein
LYAVPHNVILFIREQLSKYGSILLKKIDDTFFELTFLQERIHHEVSQLDTFQNFIQEQIGENSYKIEKIYR